MQASNWKYMENLFLSGIEPTQKERNLCDKR